MKFLKNGIKKYVSGKDFDLDPRWMHMSHTGVPRLGSELWLLTPAARQCAPGRWPMLTGSCWPVQSSSWLQLLDSCYRRMSSGPLDEILFPFLCLPLK